VELERLFAWADWGRRTQALLEGFLVGKRRSGSWNGQSRLEEKAGAPTAVFRENCC